MTTIYSNILNSQLASINRQIDRYGHSCTVHVPTVATFESKIMVAKFTEAYANTSGASLIISPRHKVYLKQENNGVELSISSNFTIEVNGVILTPLVVKKLSPNAANAIVYLLECSGENIPSDLPSLIIPSIILPMNSSENYPSTTDSIGWSIDVQSTEPAAISGAEYIGTLWQIATEESFTNIVVQSTKPELTGIYWTTPYQLERDTTYYIRCKHYGTGNGLAIETAWSSIHIFSLDEFVVPPTGSIATPSFTNTLTAGYLDSTTDVFNISAGKYHPKLSVSNYNPITAGDVASITIEVYSSNSMHPDNLLLTQTHTDTAGFYDFETATFYSFNKLYYGFEEPYVTFAADTHYYARAKYASVDNFESDWSETFVFKIQAA